MIVLTRKQFERICPKRSILGQADWFRNTYGCTLEIKGKYYLTFKTDKEETFFLLKYSNEINKSTAFNAEEEIIHIIKNWSIDDDSDL